MTRRGWVWRPSNGPIGVVFRCSGWSHSKPHIFPPLIPPFDMHPLPPSLRYSFSVALLPLILVLAAPMARAQLTVVDSFNPSQAGGLCSLAYDFRAGTIWVYDCRASDFQEYAEDGSFLRSLPRPGESANDVDIDVAPEELTLAGTTIPQGTPLFVNGESGTADIYAVDPTAGSVIASLATDFGNSHVVGAAYHPIRNTFFLVQDRVPSATLENIIAEIDPATGDVLNSFQITNLFSVNYGDLDICNTSGNLFVASSAESRFVEFEPDGTFVAYHALPDGVSGLSGVGLSCETGQAWVGSTGGTAWLLEGEVLPVEIASLHVDVRGPRAILNWTTASETDNAGFFIEHRRMAAGITSGDPVSVPQGSLWTDLGFVEGAGTTSTSTSYQFKTSLLPVGRHAFRLRQVDQDGTQTHTSIIEATVRLTTPYQMTTYPNPASDEVWTELTVGTDQRVSIAVYDVLGREVARVYEGVVRANEPVRRRMNLATRPLPSGMYMVRVRGERFTGTTRLVVAR